MPSTFPLSGTAAGLFEGNVIVDIADDAGNVLFFEQTTAQGTDPAATSDWSVAVDLGDVAEGTPVFVTVYTTSPEDGFRHGY